MKRFALAVVALVVLGQVLHGPHVDVKRLLEGKQLTRAAHVVHQGHHGAKRSPAELPPPDVAVLAPTAATAVTLHPPTVIDLPSDRPPASPLDPLAVAPKASPPGFVRAQ
jgi:hypothetical protein